MSFVSLNKEEGWGPNLEISSNIFNFFTYHSSHCKFIKNKDIFADPQRKAEMEKELRVDMLGNNASA